MPVDMDYAISVLHDDNKLNIGDRSYIFQGGTMSINNDAGGSDVVPWCFEYGEADWVSGVSYSDAFIQTRRIKLNIAEETDVSYEGNCQ